MKNDIATFPNSEDYGEYDYFKRIEKWKNGYKEELLDRKRRGFIWVNVNELLGEKEF